MTPALHAEQIAALADIEAGARTRSDRIVGGLIHRRAPLVMNGLRFCLTPEGERVLAEYRNAVTRGAPAP